MTAKFMESSFAFEHADEIPEHVEAYPSSEERDQSKFWLEGENTFSEEYYTLAIDIDNFPTARMLQVARLRALEIDQPTALSGGQGADGIQDAVHIRIPK